MIIPLETITNGCDNFIVSFKQLSLGKSNSTQIKHYSTIWGGFLIYENRNSRDVKNKSYMREIPKIYQSWCNIISFWDKISKCERERETHAENKRVKVWSKQCRNAGKERKSYFPYSSWMGAFSVISPLFLFFPSHYIRFLFLLPNSFFTDLFILFFFVF